MNILLIILALIMIWRIVAGAKRGMVKELFGFINLIFVSVVLTLAFMTFQSYKAGELVKLVPMILAIVVLSIVYALIKLIFSPAKLVAKLPLVKSVDKVLGILIGAIEVVVAYWVLCCILKYTNIVPLEAFVSPYINGNAVLANLCQNNLLDNLLQLMVNKISGINVLDFVQKQ